MDEKELLEEKRLQEQLSDARLEAAKRRRMLYLFICAVLGSIGVVAACIGTRSEEMSPMDLYGLVPLIPFVLFGISAIAAGWIVDTAEENTHHIECAIRDLHEVGG